MASFDAITEPIEKLISLKEDWSAEEKTAMKSLFKMKLNEALHEVMENIPTGFENETPEQPTPSVLYTEDDLDDEINRHDNYVIAVTKKRSTQPQILRDLLGKTNRMKNQAIKKMQVELPQKHIDIDTSLTIDGINGIQSTQFESGCVTELEGIMSKLDNFSEAALIFSQNERLTQ